MQLHFCFTVEVFHLSWKIIDRENFLFFGASLCRLTDADAAFILGKAGKTKEKSGAHHLRFFFISGFEFINQVSFFVFMTNLYILPKSEVGAFLYKKRLVGSDPKLFPCPHCEPAPPPLNSRGQRGSAS